MIARIPQQLPIACSILLAATIPCACEPPEPDRTPSASASAPDVRKPVVWQRVKDATVVAVDNADVQAQLDAATAEALRTLDDARQRWAIATSDDRALWAVKWAAPLASGTSADPPADDSRLEAGPRIEHVWVQPINWSAFRIEGVLLSEPIHGLECSRNAGAVVSFPIEELADWLHFATDPTTNPDTPFEGGFTVKVLEAKYGRAAP